MHRRVCIFVYLMNIEFNGGFLEKVLYLLIDIECICIYSAAEMAIHDYDATRNK